MKRGYLNLLAILVVFVFSFAIVSACDLETSLVSQDPYPVVPGETVKLVFQVTGISDGNCNQVSFEIQEEFPFTIDAGYPEKMTIESGVYIRDYPDFWLVPYKLAIDYDAEKGENSLDVIVSTSLGSGILTTFDIEIDDVQTDFEVYARDYSELQGELTLEIINIGENDIDSLSIEVPKQDNVQIRGSSINTVGILDSNEYTTSTFDLVAQEGEIDLIIRYNDVTDTRRTVNKTISFDPYYFSYGNEGNGGSPVGIIIVLVLVAGGGYWFYKRRKDKKRKMMHHHQQPSAGKK